MHRCPPKRVGMLRQHARSTARTLGSAVLTLPLVFAFAFGLAAAPAAAQTAPGPTSTTASNTSLGLPYRVERFNQPGPMAGVIAKIDLRDPRVALVIALADPRDPDGDGPCVGQLDTTSSAARRLDLALAVNASFFAAPIERDVLGRKVRYFVGNCTHPVGWHVSEGRVISKPTGERMRAALLVDTEGNAAIVENLSDLPPKTRYAVSGNALALRAGNVVATDPAGVRHPRTVVGLSEDRSTLWLVVIDGRQEGHSRGASMLEVGELLKKLGAHDALNVDGGGSTAMVVKDLRTGTHGIANQVSELSTTGEGVRMERPVADVIGIRLREAPPTPIPSSVAPAQRPQK